MADGDTMTCEVEGSIGVFLQVVGYLIASGADYFKLLVVAGQVKHLLRVCGMTRDESGRRVLLHTHLVGSADQKFLSPV